MEPNLQELLLKILIAFLFGIGTAVFFILGFKRLQHFYFIEYQGNSKEKFKDNLLANIYLYLGMACLFPAILVLQSGQFKWGSLVLGLCISVFLIPIIPVGVLGVYWKSYQTKKLFGGYIYLRQEQSVNAQSVPAKQSKIDLSKVKVTRRMVFKAAPIAFCVFMGVFLLTSWAGWRGSEWIGVIFRLGISGMMGFGTFMTILLVAFSRKIERLRDGKPLDDEDGI